MGGAGGTTSGLLEGPRGGGESVSVFSRFHSPCILLVGQNHSTAQNARFPGMSPYSLVVASSTGLCHPQCLITSPPSIFPAKAWSGPQTLLAIRGSIWGKALPGSVLSTEMPLLLNSANFLLRFSMRLVRYYSDFQNFHVLPYIHCLSLIELNTGWLSSPLTATFQHSRHFWIPQFLVQPEGSGVQISNKAW